MPPVPEQMEVVEEVKVESNETVMLSYHNKIIEGFQTDLGRVNSMLMS